MPKSISFFYIFLFVYNFKWAACTKLFRGSLSHVSILFTVQQIVKFGSGFNRRLSEIIYKIYIYIKKENEKYKKIKCGLYEAKTMDPYIAKLLTPLLVLQPVTCLIFTKFNSAINYHNKITK